METWERIQAIIEEKKLNINRFSKQAGLGNNVTVSKIINEKREPYQTTLMKIADAFPEFSREWIMNGEGDMYAKNPKSAGAPNATPYPEYDELAQLDLIRVIDQTEFRYLDDERYIITCPLINQYAYAGYVSGFADPEYIEEMPRHSIIVSELKLGAYRSFEVRGDSMDNGMKGCYSQGDVVTAKMLQKKYWSNPLHLHRYNRFVVVKDDGIVIKEVIKHDVESGDITLHSLNEQFSDYVINISEVQQLFYIIANTERAKI